WLGSRSLRDLDGGRITIGVDPRGPHGLCRMWLRSFAVRFALGQLAEGGPPLVPLALDGKRALRFVFIREPSAGETGLPQSAPDVWNTPHEFPRQTGSVVLNHHDDRPLVQSVVQRADPIAAGWIQTGAQAVFAAQVGMYAHKLSKRVRDKLRSKRKRRHYGAGRQSAV